MKKGIIINLFFLFFICSGKLIGQMSFYQDLFVGGVTCAGYSPPYFQTAPVTGVITVNIAPGSTIRKAYLLAGRLGPAPNTIVTLNGNPLSLDPTNQVTPTFNTLYGGASGIHAIDVSTVVSAGVNVYNLGLPAQSSTSNRYQDFYLYIAFNNGGLQSVATAIFLNTQNAAPVMNWGTLTLTNPFNLPGGDATYSYFGGYECSASDGEFITLNGTNLGNAFGPDINSGTCGGPVGSFYYNNNVATALSDDNTNQVVAAAEVLSVFNAIATNGSSTVTLSHAHASGASDNHPWGGIFVYKSGAVVLPIELSAFNAECQKGKTVLTWTTSTELNNDHFIVERSGNAVDFSSLATIKGAGTSNENKFYIYTDPNPITDVTYYRLSQVNKDGTSSFSNMLIAAPCLSSITIAPEVFPNPVTANLNVNFRSLPAGTNFVIRDSFGEVVNNGILENLNNSINVSEMKSGIYLIQIKDNENIFTYRFVKN
jgi:hypothetical protein